MAYANLTTWDEVLKTFYLPAIQEQLNHDTPLADLIEVNEEDVSGKDATIECHYGRTTGTGARADGGALPTANYQKFQTCTLPMRYNYARVSFTGPTIAATRDEKGAYARVIDTEITGAVTDLQKEVNRQLWGIGWGVLARWLSGGTTSHVVQKKYRGNSAGGDGFGSTFGGKYLEENGSCVPITLGSMSSSATATYTVEADDLTVTAVDTTSSATQDTLTGSELSVSEAAGTFYVRPASLAAQVTSGSPRLEMMGLRGIVNDDDIDDVACFTGTYDGNKVNDTLQGLAVATYSWWKSQVDIHSGATRYGGQRALDFKLMQKMFDKVERKAGKDIGPNLIITTQALRREYLELCEAGRRTVNKMELDGGWKALDYNGVPLMVDPVDAVDGEIYFLTTKDIQLYRMSDYDWMTKDGAVLSRISGYDAYEAVLFRYAELGCKRRNVQGVIADLSYDAT